MKRLDFNDSPGGPGFQIAPMIDIVFVIMLFFMVMAGGAKTERELASRLPGKAAAKTAVRFSDEQVVRVEADGTVTLNGEAWDPADSDEQPKLRAALARLKESADAAKATLFVTLECEPRAKYARTIAALNALAAAQIANVAFSTKHPGE